MLGAPAVAGAAAGDATAAAFQQHMLHHSGQAHRCGYAAAVCNPSKDHVGALLRARLHRHGHQALHAHHK